MSDHIKPEIGRPYAIQREGETIVGTCAEVTPYQIGLRVEGEDGMRWVRAEELMEVEEEQDEVPSLAECRDMLAMVMAALEHHEREMGHADR